MRLLDEWLGEYTVTADHSWPLQTTAVLEIESDVAGRVIVKASTDDLMDHHLAREIRAHHEVLEGLGDGFPHGLYSSLEARLVVTRHLPGVIAEHSEWQDHPVLYQRVGGLLARLNRAGVSRLSEDYLEKTRSRTKALLKQGQELIETSMREKTLALLDRIRPTPVEMVPTHGDFQPRNWLIDPDDLDDGVPTTTLIDFGRFDYRPWYSDLVRLHHQIFPTRPDLADALFEDASWDFAYPVPAEDRDGWLIENLLQSVATVVWATGVGDLSFADQGRIMLDRTLTEASGGHSPN